MNIELVKPNTQHPTIVQWKEFQKIQGNYNGVINDEYNPIFIQVMKAYQRKKNLTVDGYIGNNTWLAAYKDGMPFSDNQKKEFPLKPGFSPLLSRQTLFDYFGEIKYKHTPTPSNPENISILNDFETKNIIPVVIPQLSKVLAGSYTSILFHRKGADQLRGFFEALEKQGLLELLLSYGGSYNARLIRGSKTALSNHAFGTAFDINMLWNPFNGTPTALGQYGSIRELVPLAHAYGFYWGGHFTRKDGMHFEIAKLL